MPSYQSHICQCLEKIRTIPRDSPFSVTGNCRKTGGEFVESVLSLAGGLTGSGIVPGDVVAIAALNSELYIELVLAVTYIGGIVAPLNYRWSFEEARSAIELVQPKMLVVDESYNSWALELQKIRNDLSIELFLTIDESSSSSLSIPRYMTIDFIREFSQLKQITEPICATNGVTLICFTSGTTGKPKGIAISHTALIVQALAKIAIIGYGENDVYLHTAPLCHIGGLSSCIAMLLVGACHVIMPRFNAESTFQAIKEHKVTSFIAVPAMISDLITYKRESNKHIRGETVMKILNGGGSLSKQLITDASNAFPHAKIFSAYGMTEACSSLTFMTLCDPTSKISYKLTKDEQKIESIPQQYSLGGVLVGKPAPHVQIKISCDNKDHCSSSVGNILTRGLHVMVGYWVHKNVVPVDFDEHGWLDTGDIGWFDEKGNLMLVGRKKDRIKSGGENIYPEEVEAAISQHPSISQVVVIGIPDIRLAEKVVACILLKNDWKWVDQRSKISPESWGLVSAEVLYHHCIQRNLSRFKIPRAYIVWRKPFPVTSTGKIRRDDMRKVLTSDIQLPSNL